MTIKAKLFAVALACAVFAGAAYSREFKKASKPKADVETGEDSVLADNNLVDTPTAAVLDYYALQTKTRFFSQGSVLEEAAFGVLPQLNLGASATIEDFLGTGSGMRLVRPAIQAKYRFYEGTAHFPALAVGYDGQGYYYNRSAAEFREKERGVYLVASKSVFDKSFQIHPGVNVSDFDSNHVFGWVAASFTVEDTFSLMAEWDNVQRFDQSRVNAGVRFYVSPAFQLDVAVRDIGKNTQFPDGSPQRTERIVQLRYATSF